MTATTPDDVDMLASELRYAVSAAAEQYRWAYNAAFQQRNGNRVKVRSAHASPTETLALQSPSRKLEQAYVGLERALSNVRAAEAACLTLLDRVDPRHPVEPLLMQGLATRAEVAASREHARTRRDLRLSYGEG